MTAYRLRVVIPLNSEPIRSSTNCRGAALPHLLTTGDVRKILNINKDAAMHLFRRGAQGEADGIVGAFKLYGKWLCTLRALNEYIERCETPSITLSHMKSEQKSGANVSRKLRSM